jgi:hypothetical protein
MAGQTEQACSGAVSSPFTQPKFIAALFQKLCELRAGPKSVDANSLYGALHFYRYWSRDQKALKEMREGTHGELAKRLQTILRNNAAHCRKCEKLLVAEILRIYRTDNLAAHQRLSKIFVRNVRREKATYKRLDWPECFCAVALQSLIKGKVPLKKEVREAAFREMAIRLLPAGAGEQAISTKIQAFRGCGSKRKGNGPTQLNRILRDLNLGGLPEAPTRSS